jgi:hypothetical protein
VRLWTSTCGLGPLRRSGLSSRCTSRGSSRGGRGSLSGRRSAGGRGWCGTRRTRDRLPQTLEQDGQV